MLIPPAVPAVKLDGQDIVDARGIVVKVNVPEQLAVPSPTPEAQYPLNVNLSVPSFPCV